MMCDRLCFSRIAQILGILGLLYFVFTHILASPAFSAEIGYRHDLATVIETDACQEATKPRAVRRFLMHLHGTL